MLIDKIDDLLELLPREAIDIKLIKYKLNWEIESFCNWLIFRLFLFH